MNSFRIAIATTGALIALLGGAETARWGLGPLSAAMDAAAPRTDISDPGAVEIAATPALMRQIPVAPPPGMTTPVDYDAPMPPAAPVKPDPPRPADSGQAATAPETEVNHDGGLSDRPVSPGDAGQADGAQNAGAAQSDDTTAVNPPTVRPD